jgi:hypothetical protein
MMYLISRINVLQTFLQINKIYIEIFFAILIKTEKKNKALYKKLLKIYCFKLTTNNETLIK